MTEIEAIMEAHCDVRSIRMLYAAYRSVLHAMRENAEWLRRDNGLDHEADCLDSQARSAEQTYARMMRERVKMEGGGT